MKKEHGERRSCHKVNPSYITNFQFLKKQKQVDRHYDYYRIQIAYWTDSNPRTEHKNIHTRKRQTQTEENCQIRPGLEMKNWQDGSFEICPNHIQSDKAKRTHTFIKLRRLAEITDDCAVDIKNEDIPSQFLRATSLNERI